MGVTIFLLFNISIRQDLCGCLIADREPFEKASAVTQVPGGGGGMGGG